MQLLIDSVKYQRERGLNTNRHIIRKFKDDAEALKEASEVIRTVISECIERNLPIDDALAALHVATVKNQSFSTENYQKIIDESRQDKSIKIKQHRTANTTSLLRKIEEQAKKI